MPRTLIVALCLAMALPLVQAATGEQLLTGELVIDHGDDFTGGRHLEYAFLQVGKVRFALDGLDPGAYAPGTVLQVRGRQIGNTIEVARFGVTPVSESSALAATNATATFDKRVAVLLINFVQPSPSPSPSPTLPPTPSPTESPLPTDAPSPANTPQPPDLPTDSLVPTESALPSEVPSPSDTPSPSPSPSPSPTPPPQPWTREYVRGIYFDNTRSVASYYAELSDDRMSVSGDVFGWFTLTVPTSSCSYNTWSSAGRQAASVAGIDLSAYTNVVFAFPHQDACSWGGLANLPGRNTYVNARTAWSGSTWLYVASHELGHNFGVNHAATLSCSNGFTRVAFSTDCSTAGYGDPFDIMGYQGQRHMSNWHRWQLGLLTAADVQTVTESGVYTVATVEPTGGSPRIVRIPRQSDYYYLEFRQPYGRFDNFSSGAAAVNGVLIRSAPEVDKLALSKLIDTSPWTSTYNDAALAVGRGFGDSANQIYIITQSVGPTGATVLIHLGPETVPPTAVASLDATTDGEGVVSLAWPPASDDLFVSGYRVTRDGTVIGFTYGTTFVDPSASQSSTHDYSVGAVDGAGNLGEAATASIYLPDTTPPGKPNKLTATLGEPGTVALSWGAASDNVGVAGYRVSRNGAELLTTSDTGFVDTGVPEGVDLIYEVAAFDAAGNFGRAARAIAQPPDVTAPTLAGSLSFTIDTSSAVSLSWPTALDNVGIDSYLVSRDGLVIATLPGNSYTDATTEQAHGYNYAVVAADAAGNLSTELTVSVYVPDVAAPDAPADLVATPSGPRSIDLVWTAATDNVGVDHYLVTMDGVELAPTSGLGLTGVAAADGETHGFTVAAVDAAGNVGTAVAAQLTLPDVTAPGPPSPFSASSTGPHDVSLTWGTARDNVGVTGYRLTRNGALLANPDSAATGYLDTVPADGDYAYAVAAVDAAGNVGEAVAVSISVVTADVIAPTAPGGLKATAIGGRRVSLTWLASTDNRSGTIRYKVFRGTRKVAVVTTLGYVDRPANVGWYRYRVRAVDAAGNVSVFTAWVSVRATR